MDENAVVDAVCTFLMSRSWTITQRRHTTQQGIDIIARNPRTGRACYVKAKGGTSEGAGSARFGKPFLPVQVLDYVSKAVFTANTSSDGEP